MWEGVCSGMWCNERCYSDSAHTARLTHRLQSPLPPEIFSRSHASPSEAPPQYNLPSTHIGGSVAQIQNRDHTLDCR